MRDGPIYLDYHAHALLDPAILELLNDAYAGLDANPHSRHSRGEAARSRLEEARGGVAAALGWRPTGVVFTSGATEANNLLFDGLAGHLARRGRTRIVVGASEHASVMAAAHRLVRSGFDLVELAVDRDGLHDPFELRGLMGPHVGIVSIAAANHETGVLQPLPELSRATRAAGAVFHSDLSQAFGKIPIDADVLDAASLSSHKLCGPVGVGALCLSRALRPRLLPSIVGGGQEGGARSGTTPVPLCVAFAAACRLAVDSSEAEAVRVAGMRDRLLERLLDIGGVAINGSSEHRLPGNVNVSIADVDGEALVMALSSRVSMSTGSACGSRSLEPSHVLVAMGLEGERAESAVRIGLGRFTTPQEVECAASAIAAAVADLRPLRRRNAA